MQPHHLSLPLFSSRSGIAISASLFFVLALPASRATAAPPGDPNTAIRPYRVSVSDETLADLKRRLAAARLPEGETVADQAQGVQLATMKELVRYWQTEYDWRKAEAKLNALPQFMTTIDGVDIHF